MGSCPLGMGGKRMNDYKMNKQFVDKIIKHSTSNGEFNPYLFANYIVKHCVECIDELGLLNYSDQADDWDKGYRGCAKDATDAIWESVRVNK